MSYIDDLTQEVNQIFDQSKDLETLRQSVLDLVTAKSKQSYRNGMATAFNRKGKGQKASQPKEPKVETT